MGKVFRAVFTALLAAACLVADTSADRELRLAQELVNDLRQQVEAGVAPRVRLDAAEAALIDARDAVTLQKTLYGTEVTEDQVGEMVAAARRRLDRRSADFARIETLVAEGGLARVSLDLPKENLNFARHEFELAESRARLIAEIAGMARAEEALAAADSANVPLIDRFDGKGSLSDADVLRLEAAYALKFEAALPVSARGETSTHKSLGFDHRGRVDVAIHPDTPEGEWLRQYLLDANLPFFSFRTAVPGKATNAHIHIGPQSLRIPRTANGG